MLLKIIAQAIATVALSVALCTYSTTTKPLSGGAAIPLVCYVESSMLLYRANTVANILMIFAFSRELAAA